LEYLYENTCISCVILISSFKSRFMFTFFITEGCNRMLVVHKNAQSPSYVSNVIQGPLNLKLIIILTMSLTDFITLILVESWAHLV
jgi:hypothetical protein